MIYQSNLTAPDLHKRYPYCEMRPMQHSMGHSVPSDWADKAVDDEFFAIYKRCGCMTPDECAIVFNIVKSLPSDAPFLDIGSHTCFTSSFLASAGKDVCAIDPLYRVNEVKQRAITNFECATTGGDIEFYSQTSAEFFQIYDSDIKFSGAMIDGDHDWPLPLMDGLSAAKHIESAGVLIFHDFWGRPVWAAVERLMECGMKSRVYNTPHGLAVCWTDSTFRPPDHIADPRIDWAGVRGMASGFPYERCC